jgi:uncharacterized protein YdhG (YjbR/CyaY superfamily)
LLGVTSLDPSISARFANELCCDRSAQGRARTYDTAKTKTTIRFAPDRPLPAALVRKLVKARIAENEQRTK